MIESEIDKYLKKYGSVNWQLVKANSAKYEMIIVIPVLAEYENIRRFFNSILKNDLTYISKVLFVFVVNNTSEIEVLYLEDNAKTLVLLNKIINNDILNDELVEKINKNKISLAFVDASSKSNELPNKTGGVGLARKIGMDLALKEFDYSKEKQILVCTDADSQFEENYLIEIYNYFKSNNYKAAHIKYEHPVEGTVEERLAIICYEIFLRYYVLGLKYAKSYFAFHTIGSSMVCDAESYIKIQGMNKRKAAEDFYFLEKLAKITEIGYIDKTKVIPSGRKSWRVPFGTGQRVARFLDTPQDEYTLYSPECFVILKKWLEVFDNNYLDAKSWIEKSKEINNNLYNFLIQQEFEKSWQDILSNSKSESQLNKQRNIWFDGFRTLKLIHHLRDEEFGKINMFDAIDILFSYFNEEKIIRDSSIPNEKIQMQYLEKLRQLT